MLGAALQYIDKGWHVFPLQPGGKAPLVAGGFKQATTDVKQVTSWWMSNPTANIGISLDPSGICVVDIDTHGDINGFESLPMLGDMPETAIARTPSGGAHYVFNNEGEPPPRKVGLVEGIDLLANGYIVAAPSVIDGKPYRWEAGGNGIADFPQQVRDMAAPVVHAVHTQATGKPIAAQDRTRTMHRASLWLEQAEAAYQGQAGHSKLLWAAQGLVNGFMLSRADTLSLLWAEFNPRCAPSWDQSKPSDVKDFERKVDQAMANPVKAPGWLLGDDAPYVPEPWIASFTAAFAGGLVVNMDVPAKEASPEVQAELDEDYKNIKELVEPSWKPSGLVGDIVQHILNTAQIKQPKYAIASALTAVGTLLGQKVKSGWQSGRTNLYCMAVGGTSTGKDHPLSMAERILEQAGAGALIGGTDVTSDSAIEKRLTNHPVTLYPWDEAGHTLGGFGSSADSHRATVVPTLMKLWSHGNKTYRGKDRAGKENESMSIKYPCLSIYGTGSTDKIASSLRKDQLSDGWLPRCLYFISHDLGTLSEDNDTSEAIPAGIVEQCTAFHGFSNPAITEASVFSVQATTQDWAISVPVDADAKAVLKAFFNESRAVQNTQEETSELWGKAAEQADRIALIVACGKVHDLNTARVTLEDVNWAIEVVRYCINSFAKLISDKVVENDYERSLKMVLEKIKRAGRKGITKSELTRVTQAIKGHERTDILRSLMDSEKVVLDIRPSKTKPTAVYIYKPS